ncbi:hypothetical protein ACP4OV_023343 [Aristida adscensionis]
MEATAAAVLLAARAGHLGTGSGGGGGVWGAGGAAGAGSAPSFAQMGGGTAGAERLGTGGGYGGGFLWGVGGVTGAGAASSFAWMGGGTARAERLATGGGYGGVVVWGAAGAGGAGAAASYARMGGGRLAVVAAPTRQAYITGDRRSGMKSSHHHRIQCAGAAHDAPEPSGTSTDTIFFTMECLYNPLLFLCGHEFVNFSTRCPIVLERADDNGSVNCQIYFSVHFGPKAPSSLSQKLKYAMDSMTWKSTAGLLVFLGCMGLGFLAINKNDKALMVIDLLDKTNRTYKPVMEASIMALRIVLTVLKCSRCRGKKVPGEGTVQVQRC